jgi:hypothetical protein
MIWVIYKDSTIKGTKLLLTEGSKLSITNAVRMSSLLICEFTMVATMDITMSPKLIIVHEKIKTYYDVPIDEVV